MGIQVGKWGRSLAIRLPKDIVEKFGLKEGDEITLEAIEQALRAAQEMKRQDAIEQMRQARWPLPDDYKFDREEANAR